MKPSEVLRGAKGRLSEESQWWKGGDSGQECAVTAIIKTCWEDQSNSDQAVRFFRSAVHVRDGHTIAAWNDSPKTTFAMLHAGFDKAISLAEQAEEITRLANDEPGCGHERDTRGERERRGEESE